MRWKQSLIATALGVALVAAACGGDNKGSTGATTTAGGATTTAASGGGASTTSGGSSGLTKISIGETLAPVSLDISQESGAAIPQALLYNVYETLVKIDDQGKFQPLLAKA